MNVDRSFNRATGNQFYRHIVIDESAASAVAVDLHSTDNTVSIKTHPRPPDLRASEARYRRLFETAQDGILILDAEECSGKILDANPFLIDLLGYSLDELIGKELWEIGLFRDRQHSKAAMEELMENGYIRYEDLPLETRQGKAVAVEFVSNSYMVGKRKVIQCNIRDLRDRKTTQEIVGVRADLQRTYDQLRTRHEEAEDALRQSEELWFRLIEDLPVGIFILKPDGTPFFANALSRSILGKDVIAPAGPALLASTYQAFVTGTDDLYPTARMPVVRALQGEASSVDDMEVRTDAGIKSLEVFGRPIFDSRGNLSYAVAAFLDITERRHLERERTRVEDALRASEDDYRDLFEHSLDLVYTHDPEGVILTANPAAAATLGYADPDELVGVRLLDLLLPEDQGRFAEYLQRFRSERRAEGLMRVVTRSGERKILEYRNVIRSTGGTLVVQGVSRDVTRRVAEERRVAQSEERYRRLFERNIAGVFRSTVDGRILDVNDAFVGMFGFDSASDLLGTDARELYAEGANRTSYVDRLRTQKAVLAFEVPFRKRDGSSFWGLVSAAIVDDEVQIIEGTVIDITSRKQSEEITAWLATHDALTGLPNRSLFHDRAEQALAVARREGTIVGIAFLDLDGFKPVNDRFGHAAGDLVLQEVAHRITSSIRQTDTAARVGGDEFAIMFNLLQQARDGEEICRQLIEKLKEPIQILSEEIRIGATVGLCSFPEDGADVASLLSKADEAMYRGKATGKSLTVVDPM